MRLNMGTPPTAIRGREPPRRRRGGRHRLPQRPSPQRRRGGHLPARRGRGHLPPDHPAFTPDPLAGQLGDGVDSNDKAFLPAFPYPGHAVAGLRGQHRLPLPLRALPQRAGLRADHGRQPGAVRPRPHHGGHGAHPAGQRGLPPVLDQHDLRGRAGRAPGPAPREVCRGPYPILRTPDFGWETRDGTLDGSPAGDVGRAPPPGRGAASAASPAGGRAPRSSAGRPGPRRERRSAPLAPRVGRPRTPW